MKRWSLFLVLMITPLNFLDPAEAASLKRPLSFSISHQGRPLERNDQCHSPARGSRLVRDLCRRRHVLRPVERFGRLIQTKGEPMAKWMTGIASSGRIFFLQPCLCHSPDTDRIWFGTYFYGFGEGEFRTTTSRRTLHGKPSTPTPPAILRKRSSLWRWMETGFGLDRKGSLPLG